MTALTDELEISDTSLIRGLAGDVFAEGIREPREIARALLARDPDLFTRLSDAERENVLTHFIQYTMKRERNYAIRGERATTIIAGQTESVIRIAVVGHAYWSSTWSVHGVRKQTRELTRGDLLSIITDRFAAIAEERARVFWLKACVDLIDAHKAKTLGDLEKKGISLPNIEVSGDGNERRS